MSEGKTCFGKYQCKLCQLGDGTGDYDDDVVVVDDVMMVLNMMMMMR